METTKETEAPKKRNKHCQACRCPLLILSGDERRRYCARCVEERAKAKREKALEVLGRKRANCRDYRKKNRDQLIERDRQRYVDNREERLAQARAYYQAKKEKAHVVQ